MQKVLSLATAIAATLAVTSAVADSIFVVPQGTDAPAAYAIVADYGSYRLYRGDPALAPAGAWVLDSAHELKFDRLHIDTRRSVSEVPPGFAVAAPTAAALQVVQFAGPLKDAWLEQLRAAGAVPIQYIESNGYLVWADAAARSRLATMAQAGNPLQYSQPLPAFIKLGNSLFTRLQQGADEGALLDVIVQRYRHGADADGRARIGALGLKPIDDWTPQLDYEVARFSASLAQVRALIELPDVYWVGEYLEPTLDDEVQAQIIRGNFNADLSGPLAPGYLDWLQTLGFSANADAYPILDITDSGVGDGTVATGDPTLHRYGDASQPTRMVFNQACTKSNGIVDGHGHLNANIALGYDVRDNVSTPGARFPGEYQRGQGMNPFGRLGATRVFAPGFDLGGCGGSYAGVIAASYAAGARISSNSWGCAGCAGQYDVSSQAYDAGTRDADPAAPGNQPLITVFSAGNDGPGPGTVGAPGNGKNMITVGASENPRTVDENGTWIDGCQIGAAGADDAMDVIFFSSRGPSPGNRVKPDLIAPGTHVTGTRANPGDGSNICDATRPLGNATYAASSGTSHSTPAISGVASLAWWWIANGQGSLDFEDGPPSVPTPALMKAWLVAHPVWLTGEGANDDLPSNAQGFGMPELEDMFSDTPKWLLNETHVLGASGDAWSATFEAAVPGAPVRIVLAWTDAPGAIGTSPQVNNLDLDVTRGSNVYLGNHLSGQWSTPGGVPDAANNVEAIFLPGGTPGPFTVRVHALNIAGDGVPGNADPTDQDFAIVCSNCARGPTFVFDVKPQQQSVCSATSASVPLMLSSLPILGFEVPLSLSVEGNPPGTSATFSVNPVAPGSMADLNIGDLAAAAAGRYRMAVEATAGGIVRTRYSLLDLFSASPSAFELVVPVAGAGNVDRQPLLSWQASAQAASYRIEIARDAAFADIVYSAETQATSHVVESRLEYATLYFWRVTALNACGETPVSAVASFTTTPVPGECPTGTTAAASYSNDFEAASTDWTTTGSFNTWALSSARAHSGTQAFLGQDLANISDQRLASPPISLPAGQAPLILEFWSHQTLEDRIGGCYDGALLEISTDDGISWSQVPDGQLLVGGYDGPISTSFNNPARGKQAWCGDPRDWTQTLVGLDGYAGQTVRLRFRLATDSSTGRVPDGFYLDDVRVQSCASPADEIFADGFD
ncbi:MAG: S8 family serine peptidase [Xanthomonadales bacterium]|nr:S8 family serine peptidase [Xanthomonadales bacterium]